ncbi:DUF2946 domain-containing protein [Pseudomonas huaxiensis]|uniref:DUF2946 domain-containing protein n=1 Tax=Pseudomonas huaxiensis TaxID=2213017 RepID=UPI000DA6B2CC|nr:DUF2946 domain-containing protein [Pseudomonas huaxiensis]
MPAQRLAYAWIACFAVLFNLLAMPLSANAARAPTEQLLWGAFCSTGGTKLIAVSLGQPDQQNDDHAVMQHCWCCSGAAPLLALPGQAPQLVLPTHAFSTPLAIAQPAQPTPRELWPSLNPRASPAV